MKKLVALLLVLWLSLGTSPSLSEETIQPSLLNACIVTEVLDWGETVTALRLEYSEEIWCGAIENSNEHPGKVTYSLVNDRDIVNLYVNNSGIKDDIQLKGKYVFINLGIQNEDHMTYRDQVVFNTAARVRPALSHFYLFQQEPIQTVNGNIIPPSGRIDVGTVMRIGLDDFKTFTYTNTATGNFLNYHLYIPKGYESKENGQAPLPLIVHYPSGDYKYEDDGRFMGALFTHPDALYWTSKDAQSENPAFVVTVGGKNDDNWGAEFEKSEMQQNYVSIIKLICQQYNIDTSRIYCVSLAGGTNSMFQTILANPHLFAAEITTAYDPYHVFKDIELAEDSFAKIMNFLPGWYFAGLTDGSGAGCLGTEDVRYKGERLRDIGYAMNEKGFSIDVGYGEEGELMWNGLLRGPDAEEEALEQVSRAKENNCDNLITLFIPGTILQTMHWSWNAAYSNAVVRNWLFEHVNNDPMLK